jgi:hypothetical protein
MTVTTGENLVGRKFHSAAIALAAAAAEAREHTDTSLQTLAMLQA